MLNGKATIMNPAYRFGVQQADKFRAADDVRRSMTDEAAAIRPPVNLPSRGHLAQMRMLFVSEGEGRPLAMA